MQDMSARVRMKEAAAIARSEPSVSSAELPVTQDEDEMHQPLRKVARHECQAETNRGLTVEQKPTAV